MRKFVALLLMIAIAQANGQNALIIPDTMVGPDYQLTIHRDSMQFFPGKISHTYGFNANHYLGPTLILNKGSNVNISVNNLLMDTTTVHWHGLHVPAIWDGGPMQPILPGGVWNPKFKVMDHAATYWYHPHLHMQTAEQAIKGAVGLIIVRDSIESSLSLPGKYGLDDFPLIVQCQQYDSFNQAMPRGMVDSTLLVNGTFDPFLDAPAQMVRFRLLNASGERVFNFGFTGNRKFYQIASDGGLLDKPWLTGRVRLAPGERAEIVMDLNGMNGQSMDLMSFGSELPMGIQGGPTMPMPPGSPDMNSPLNGVDYKLMKINIVPQTIGAITVLPDSFTHNGIYDKNQANVERTIRFTADSLMVMDGPFYFNDSSFDMMRIDYRIPVNNIEIWKLVNETMVAHPFHLHDAQFYILNRNGISPDSGEMGRKDVVLVPSGDTVRFITRFSDFTDSVNPYMFHCHILMHEDDGMMGTFMVVDKDGTGTVKINHDNLMELYPNPAGSILNIRFGELGNTSELSIRDTFGKTILSDTLTNGMNKELDISGLSCGIYLLVVNSKDHFQIKKFIKL